MDDLLGDSETPKTVQSDAPVCISARLHQILSGVFE